MLFHALYEVLRLQFLVDLMACTPEHFGIIGFHIRIYFPKKQFWMIFPWRWLCSCVLRCTPAKASADHPETAMPCDWNSNLEHLHCLNNDQHIRIIRRTEALCCRTEIWIVFNTPNTSYLTITPLLLFVIYKSCS